MKGLRKHSKFLRFVFWITCFLVSCRPTQENQSVEDSNQEPTIQSTVDIVDSEMQEMEDFPLEGTSDVPSENCKEITGSVEEIFVPDSQTGEQVRVLLYLSPCQSMTADEGHSLLILLHGQSSKADQWVDLGLNEVLDEGFLLESTQSDYGG